MKNYCCVIVTVINWLLHYVHEHSPCILNCSLYFLFFKLPLCDVTCAIIRSPRSQFVDFTILTTLSFSLCPPPKNEKKNHFETLITLSLPPVITHQAIIPIDCISKKKKISLCLVYCVVSSAVK